HLQGRSPQLRLRLVPGPGRLPRRELPLRQSRISIRGRSLDALHPGSGMQGEEVRRRLLLAVVAAMVLLGAAVAGAAGPSETFKVGNLSVEIEGGIKPTKLPKNEMAPITLQVGGSIATADGSHPAALKSLKLEFDKNGALNTEGLPTCTVGKLTSTLTAQ